jgi:hypothetical protein
VAAACKKNGVSTARGAGGDRPRVAGELRSGRRRGGPPSGILDLEGFEDSDKEFVQLDNSVITRSFLAYLFPRAYNP